MIEKAADEQPAAKPVIRLLIVDDHPVVRAGLNSMLRKGDGLEVVCSAHNGEEALELLHRHAIDVVLLDLRMPGMDGIDTLRLMKSLSPLPRVLILSNFEYDEEIYRAVEAGANGYLVKDTTRDEIIAAIAAVHAGASVFPDRIAARLSDRKARVSLSPRELEILELLSKGLTNKDIGRALEISKFTVRNHLNKIMVKLEVSDRTEAAMVAIEQGIITVSPS